MLTSQPIRRRLSAIAVVAVLVVAVFVATGGRIAESPIAGATDRFAAIGPGALGAVRFELAKVGASQSKVSSRSARAALVSTPLSSDALAGIAAAELNTQGNAASERRLNLLTEAIRRNPRSRSALILMFREKAKRGDVKGAFTQLATLNRLSPDIVEKLMDALTVRISTVAQLEQAMSALQGHDTLYQPFIYRMIGKNKPREVVLRLAELVPAKIIARPLIRDAVVRLLVDAKEFSAAKLVWQKGPGSGQNQLVNSPDFSNRHGSTPFDWQLYVGPVGSAERLAGGGITIAYYDRTPGFLAAQTLTLSPGGYQVRVDYEVIDGRSDNVRIRITCNENGETLVETPLAQTKAGPVSLALPFSVKATGCAAQSAVIVGIVGENRGQMQLTVRRFDVVRLGTK